MEKRNKQIAKKDKDLKRIVFVNKNSGQKYMISNKKTMEKIDGPSEEIRNFMRNRFENVPRAAIGSLI